MRQSLVIANWKLNGDLALLDSMMNGLSSQTGYVADVVICPPAVYLAAMQQRSLATATDSFKLHVGAQNCSEHTQGAFTGELAPQMLREVGCEYVILGHSERRSLYAETDALIAQKVATAQQQQLKVVLCVGESLEQREQGQTLDVVTAQIAAVSAADVDASQLIIAYEPVWAIGTGKTATPEQAQEVHAAIRQFLNQHSGVGEHIALLYGGSVKADNAAVLFAQPDIDGGLIGGASLDVEQFRAICSAVKG